MFIIKSGVANEVGSVILWYGLAGDVPSGWEVYTAAADAFVMGAASGELDTVATGANTHSHTRSSGTTGSEAAHQHDLSVDAGLPDDSAYAKAGFAGIYAARYNHEHDVTSSNVTAAGAHNHTQSSTNSESHLPPYHRLYWIRRTN